MLTYLAIILAAKAPFRNHSRLILKVSGKVVQIVDGIRKPAAEFQTFNYVKSERGYEIRVARKTCMVRKVGTKKWTTKSFPDEILGASYFGRQTFSILYWPDEKTPVTKQWDPFIEKEVRDFYPNSRIDLGEDYGSLPLTGMVADFVTHQFIHGGGPDLYLGNDGEGWFTEPRRSGHLEQFFRPGYFCDRVASIGIMSLGSDREVTAITWLEASPKGNAVAAVASRIHGGGWDRGVVMIYHQPRHKGGDPVVRVQEVWGDRLFWSPDGRYLACATRHDLFKQAQIVEVKTMKVVASFDGADVVGWLPAMPPEALNARASKH